MNSIGYTLAQAFSIKKLHSWAIKAVDSIKDSDQSLKELALSQLIVPLFNDYESDALLTCAKMGLNFKSEENNFFSTYSHEANLLLNDFLKNKHMDIAIEITKKFHPMLCGAAFMTISEKFIEMNDFERAMDCATINPCKFSKCRALLAISVGLSKKPNVLKAAEIAEQALEVANELQPNDKKMLIFSILKALVTCGQISRAIDFAKDAENKWRQIDQLETLIKILKNTGNEPKADEVQALMNQIKGY